MKIKEMEKSEIIDSLEFALIEILCKNITGVDEVIMKNNIKSFIKNVVEDLDSKEILEKFNSPEESLRLFIEYIADHMEEEKKDNTLH